MGRNSDNSESDAGKAKQEKNGRQSHTGFCREEKPNVCQVEKGSTQKRNKNHFQASENPPKWRKRKIIQSHL